jgi:hypothetical protein
MGGSPLALPPNIMLGQLGGSSRNLVKEKPPSFPKAKQLGSARPPRES